MPAMVLKPGHQQQQDAHHGREAEVLEPLPAGRARADIHLC
jgi:hypothetical protein